jgi:predicted secreted Zn-dependent protease
MQRPITHLARGLSAPARACAPIRARIGLAGGVLLLCVALAGCSGGGIYANVGIAGPTVGLGPVKVHTGVNLGRWL